MILYDFMGDYWDDEDWDDEDHEYDIYELDEDDYYCYSCGLPLDECLEGDDI